MAPAIPTDRCRALAARGNERTGGCRSGRLRFDRRLQHDVQKGHGRLARALLHCDDGFIAAPGRVFRQLTLPSLASSDIARTSLDGPEQNPRNRPGWCLERFQAKGTPVRVKKTRPNKILERRL